MLGNLLTNCKNVYLVIGFLFKNVYLVIGHSFGLICSHCLKQYVGKSTNKLQKRISGHRSHMNDLVFDSENDYASLAEHLKLSHSVMDPDLFNHSFSFTIHQVSPLDLDACEQRWVHGLNTLTPFKLNKEPLKMVFQSQLVKCVGSPWVLPSERGDIYFFTPL